MTDSFSGLDFVLIVGLGNPGLNYRYTRHNFGALVVERFADQLGISLKAEKAFEGLFGIKVCESKKIALLMPTTYMNLSGQSVKKVVNYYKLTYNQLLIACDDIYLPLGEIRIRPEGGVRGHNGLRSIEQQLSSSKYPRLQLGIGLNKEIALDQYVLSPFPLAEKEKLEETISTAVELIYQWIAARRENKVQSE